MSIRQFLIAVIVGVSIQTVSCSSEDALPTQSDEDAYFNSDELIGFVTADDFSKLNLTGQSNSGLSRLSQLEQTIESYRNQSVAHDEEVLRSVFAARLRPIDGSVREVDITAYDGSHQLVTIFAIPAGVGACFMDLMPPDDEEEGGEGNNNQEPDGNANNDGANDSEGNGSSNIGPDGLPMSTSDSESDTPEGADEKAGSRCGTISAIRSLLKMGWVSAEDATLNDSLKPSFVRRFDSYIKRHQGKFGLHHENQKKAHSDFLPEGFDFKMTAYEMNEVSGANDGQNEGDWNAIIGHLNNDGADCILTFELDIRGGEYDEVIASVLHDEMINSVSIDDDIVTVSTQNAAQQGFLHGEGIKRVGETRTLTYHTNHMNGAEKEKHATVRCYWKAPRAQ